MKDFTFRLRQKLSEWGFFTTAMVLLLDGNSEICAHVRGNLCYLICFRHLIRAKSVTNRIFFSEKTYFPSCVRNIIWVTIWYHDNSYLNAQCRAPFRKSLCGPREFYTKNPAEGKPRVVDPGSVDPGPNQNTATLFSTTRIRITGYRVNIFRWM